MSRADLDAERVRFEAWAISIGWAKAQLTRYNSDGYPTMQVQAAWEGWQAALASQAPAVQQEPVVIQRTKNPYTIGAPETYWRRGYNGVRMIGYPSYASKQFYKEGEFARKSDDLAAQSPQGDAEDCLSKLTRFGWSEAYIGDTSELIEDQKGTYVKFADVAALVSQGDTEGMLTDELLRGIHNAMHCYGYEEGLRRARAAIDAARKSTTEKGGTQ